MTPDRRRSQSCMHDAGGADSDGRDRAERVVGDGWRAGGRGGGDERRVPDMAVIGDVRPLGAELERSYPVYVRGRLKFRVKQIVYVAFSLDETVMGFAFPREERAALVASDPPRFQMPSASDMRFNWVHADLAALDPTEARELVVDAWRMVVPKKLSLAYDLSHPDGPGSGGI